MDPFAQAVFTCKKPVNRLFWDVLHPTTGGHHTLCDGLFVSVEREGVRGEGGEARGTPLSFLQPFALPGSLLPNSTLLTPPSMQVPTLIDGGLYANGRQPSGMRRRA